MIKTCLICIVLLSLSCVYTKINRTGRITRRIKVHSITSISEAELVKQLLIKAMQKRCDEIQLVEVVEGSHAEGTCYGYAEQR